MPKPTKGPRLGGGPAHERLLLSNLANALFTHGRITTTETKAKRLRPVAERLITFAKRGDLHARRRVIAQLRDKSVVHTLFTEIAPQVEDRQGGYTRITKLGFRKGDNAPLASIELVLEPVSGKPAPVKRDAAPAAAARSRRPPRRPRSRRPRPPRSRLPSPRRPRPTLLPRSRPTPPRSRTTPSRSPHHTHEAPATQVAGASSCPRVSGGDRGTDGRRGSAPPRASRPCSQRSARTVTAAMARAERITGAGRRVWQWSRDSGTQPRLLLAAKAALAATIAWTLAKYAPGVAADYPYYAPLGAIVAMRTTVFAGLRAGLQTLVGITLGILIAGFTMLIGDPGVIAVALAVGLGVLVSGFRILGEGYSWVPMAALFVLLVGGANAEGYSFAYVVQMAIGVGIGLAVNLTVVPRCTSGTQNGASTR